MSRALVISFTDLGSDPRVDRQIGFLRKDHDVVAAGLGPPHQEGVDFVDLTPPPESRPRALARRSAGLTRLLARRSLAVYWRHMTNRAAYARLRDVRFDVVVANDVSALPLAVRLARGRPVVFDAHELATTEGAHLWWWRTLIAPYLDRLLHVYLPHVAGMMTVSPSIAEHYASRYGIPRPEVVTNAPWRAALAPTPVGGQIRMLHHGTSDPARRLDLMIDLVERLDERFTLDLMLMPTHPAELRRLRERARRSGRVRIVDPVAMHEIVQVANAYDIGLCLLPPTQRSLELSLPNKVFEFIQARLAVATGPSVEIAAVVREWECGVVADDFTPDALARSLGDLSPEAIAAFKSRSDVAADHLCAERNEQIVRALVRRALATRP